MIAVNDHALHVIEAAEASSHSITASLRALVPFAATPDDVRRQAVTKAFGAAMAVLAGNMARLQLGATSALARLDRLEARLGTLHTLVAAEDATLADERAELLAQLWTHLGGNKRALRGLDTHRALLAGVGGVAIGFLFALLGAAAGRLAPADHAPVALADTGAEAPEHIAVLAAPAPYTAQLA